MPPLLDQLSVLLPRVLAWANTQAAHIARHGEPLNAASLTLASRVGVVHPERIRILVVPTVPVPEEPGVAAHCDRAEPHRAQHGRPHPPLRHFWGGRLFDPALASARVSA